MSAHLRSERFRGVFCTKKAEKADFRSLDAREMGREQKKKKKEGGGNPNYADRLFSARNSTKTLASQAASSLTPASVLADIHHRAGFDLLSFSPESITGNE